jgi:hypothetical protein
MERYVCIHGHFYQPPRENPWFEAIEFQDSACPYHDWNERITAECYAPNAASRILDDHDRIVRIVNNYAKISFDIGPTLLSWLEEKASQVYRAILEADRESRATFSGHGSALAQVYNHMIMPLANRHDKYTQVVWGMRDFEHRFGRRPEGMWLPETAVDLETLDILAELDIQFTILAPHQASRVRRPGARSWRDVSGGRIDPTTAYLLRLPSGRTINLFFYDGPISRAVAFEGLLSKGEHFAGRVLSGFSAEGTWPQLVHIATDGETYGHHHRFGDMALAYALHYIQAGDLARLTNYGEYLERHGATHFVEILENTSWSCVHGVERWRGDCGCSLGEHPEWHQAWRAPLRVALDWLRDTLASRYEERGRPLLKDPWAARNDYIDVILDRSPERVEGFLDRHAARELDEPEKITVLKLLELQRHLMLMYTSCGWFFDELSGIETVQILQYAGRVVQLAEELFGDALESHFLDLLEQAKSNVPERRNGRLIYDQYVKPAVVGWEKVGAHYAVSSLFEDYGERTKIYCYTVNREDHESFAAGKAKLAVGRAGVTSDVTRQSSTLTFGVLHLGDHNLKGGVRAFNGEEAYRSMVRETSEAFARTDFPEVIRLLDKHFGDSTYSLRSLFRDEQRKVVHVILEATLAEAEAVYLQLYKNHAPLMRFLTELGMPLPKAIQAAAEFVLNAQLRRAFECEGLDLERIGALLEEAKGEGIPLDLATLEFALRRNIERIARELLAAPGDLPLLQKLEAAVGLAGALPFAVNLWEVQNVCYSILKTVYAERRASARDGDTDAQVWTAHFRALCGKLSIREA